MESKHLQTIAHGLLLVSVMLAVIAAALWFKSDALESKVQAQMRTAAAREDAGVPDSGKQRLLLIEQLDALNRRVADLERGLREGAFVIQTIEAKAGQKPRARDEAKETEK
jgi:hypothetical protein